MIDVILAWLVAEDDGAKSRIKSLLADRDEGLEVIRNTLQGTVHISTSVRLYPGLKLTVITEQLDGLGEVDSGGQDTKDMLGTLLQFL